MTGRWSNIQGLLDYLDLPVTRLRLALANLEDLALTGDYGLDEYNQGRARAATRDLSLYADIIASTATTLAQMTTAALHVSLTEADHGTDHGQTVEVDRGHQAANP